MTFDRFFFPTLVFAALFAATSAFVVDAAREPAAQAGQRVVQLERVVVVAQRDTAAVALAETETAATAR